jgi:hypothetical protein
MTFLTNLTVQTPSANLEGEQREAGEVQESNRESLLHFEGVCSLTRRAPLLSLFGATQLGISHYLSRTCCAQALG